VDGSRLKIISGEQDSVVRPAEMAELMQIAKKRGATVVSREEYAHPFQDADLTIRRRRLIEVADFLTQK
jgi:predicted esterase